VAGVVHGEKMKTSAEVRERKKRWLFQAWGWPACGWDSYLWWSWWWPSLVGGTAERERERKTAETGVEGLVFGRFLTRFSPPSGHAIHPYL